VANVTWKSQLDMCHEPQPFVWEKPHSLVVQELNVHFVIRISTSIISTQEELLPAHWKHNRHANFFVPAAAIIAAYGSGHYCICKVAEGGGPHRDRCVLVNLLTRRKVREFCHRIRMTVVNELDCTTIKSRNLYEGRLMHNGFRDKGHVLINSSNSWTQSGNWELRLCMCKTLK
jgi:hypothetical protein